MAGSVTLISGHRIGPYEVTGMIGAGGMGEVYRAHDSRLNRDVALKVLARSITRTSPRSMAWRRTRAIADRARRWCLNSGMKKILPILATSALLLGSVSTANAQITFDLRFGQPPPSPRAYPMCRRSPGRTTSGLKGTGIRRDRTMSGTTATGRGHRTWAYW